MTKIMMGVIFSGLFLLSGCATIMSHGPQTLHILSQPDGATCEITDPTYRDWETDRKSTRLNSSHITRSRMPSSA